MVVSEAAVVLLRESFYSNHYFPEVFERWYSGSWVHLGEFPALL